MVWEVFDVKTKSGKIVKTVSLRSLLRDIQVMDIVAERNEKLLLAKLTEGLMAQLNKLPPNFYKAEKEEVPHKDTPPEPPAAVPKEEKEVVEDVPDEVEVDLSEVPKPPKPKQQKENTQKEEEKDDEGDELFDDEFPLRK